MKAQDLVTFYSGKKIPLELHKVRVVQKLNLVPVERRVEAMKEAGYNTFQLNTKDVYLDMLTDSGVNAMSDNQVAAMFRADDAYAGSQSFDRLKEAVSDVFGKRILLPVHQGRAAENIISRTYVKPGMVVPMNYHFTTTHAHIDLNGGTIEELVADDARIPAGTNPFKGNMDIAKLRDCIQRHGEEKIAFVRMEASTNLIGGQPFSIANLREVKKVCQEHGLMLVLDASLIGENAYFVKRREAEFLNASVKDILHALCELADIVYFSARKVSSSRGGGICTNDHKLAKDMEFLVPLFEGFLTYGGISVREIEAMAVGLYETCDETVISQSPDFIEYFIDQMGALGIPCVTPPGGLGAHIDASKFLPHIKQEDYPAGALAAAFYIISGVRGMERGTLSSVRDENGKDILADIELLRLAFPRRLFTLSQIMYVADRMEWLYDNRELIGGLHFVEEPPVLRFFMGKLQANSDWPEKLAAKFRQDFGNSL